VVTKVKRSGWPRIVFTFLRLAVPLPNIGSSNHQRWGTRHGLRGWRGRYSCARDDCLFQSRDFDRAIAFAGKTEGLPFQFTSDSARAITRECHPGTFSVFERDLVSAKLRDLRMADSIWSGD
jgi:hypothetical protein